MAQKVFGNTRGFAPSQLKRIERLFHRKFQAEDLVTREFAREMFETATELKRRIGVLVSREGAIEEVCVGTKDILYLPDLGRYRLGAARLRRLRLLFTDLSKGNELAVIPADIMTDLEKLRLDAVVGVRVAGNRMPISFAHLIPAPPDHEGTLIAASHVESLRDIGELSLDFEDFMGELEAELEVVEHRKAPSGAPAAVLVAVGEMAPAEMKSSLAELRELAETAGVEIRDTIVQRRRPDPKSVVGKGKLEEIVLRSLRLGADILIFNTELKPAQWRVITNSTELKVLDRSMVILDIFAQRAQSSEGRLQVELAQLKYNLPRLVEKDVGLSRLSGGIGGRGPGETKLEVSRRRTRERITELERRLKEVRKQRAVRRSRRQAKEVPLIAVVGYTNAGKSTLFNRLTNSKVLVEDKLFATLDPYQRQFKLMDAEGILFDAVLSDTVGFIRDLPEELMTAFRATLEELYEASLLIHLVDMVDPLVTQKLHAVEKIIREMEIPDVPVVIVGNKADQADEDTIQSWRADGRFAISAETGSGLAELRAMLIAKLQTLSLPVESSKVEDL